MFGHRWDRVLGLTTHTLLSLIDLWYLSFYWPREVLKWLRASGPCPSPINPICHITLQPIASSLPLPAAKPLAPPPCLPRSRPLGVLAILELLCTLLKDPCCLSRRAAVLNRRRSRLSLRSRPLSFVPCPRPPRSATCLEGKNTSEGLHEHTEEVQVSFGGVCQSEI